MKVLRSKLYEAERRKRDESIASQRKNQIGTGDRSERIRTYNYPQRRVTDHRIGLTLYDLENILNGKLDILIDALISYEHANMLAAENTQE
ncbi:Peptide chain release factor RF1 [bioreactor metagenome]|uniref:Peptide chain release factor RF1 n=1 Tax=bioreactor metagenome TaxID=1076179 RepID=A0A645HNH2_9ZZZZ